MKTHPGQGSYMFARRSVGGKERGREGARRSVGGGREGEVVGLVCTPDGAHMCDFTWRVSMFVSVEVHLCVCFL